MPGVGYDCAGIDFASHVNGVTVYQFFGDDGDDGSCESKHARDRKTASLPYGLDGSQSVPTNACAYGKKYNTDYCRG